MIPEVSKQLPVIRKYFLEVVVIGLCIAVVTLFRMHIDTNDFIRTELKELVIKSTIAIESNNNLLKQKQND